MNYLVTAIGTDSGKTIISSALALALNANYWKPIQAGYPTDTETVNKLTDGSVHTLPERYVLNTPASPHYAAEVDGLQISMNDFELPKVKSPLVVEGAGGCLVPINEKEYVIDLAKKLNLEIILVSNNYLGSINHTLLTLEYLRVNSFPIKCIIFNGPENKSTESIIMKHCDAPCLHKVGQLDNLSSTEIINLSEELKSRWNVLGF